MKKILLVFAILATLLLYGCGQEDPTPIIVNDNLEDFAKCLTDQGAELYGAEWCPHCQEQKELFGASLEFIDYTECTEDQQKCDDEGIKYLPTWKFKDGTSDSGVKPFGYFADKTGCVLQLLDQ